MTGSRPGTGAPKRTGEAAGKGGSAGTGSSAAGPSDQFRPVFKAFHLSDGLVRITRGLRHRQVREEGSGLPGQFAGRHGVRKHHVRDQKVDGRSLL